MKNKVFEKADILIPNVEGLNLWSIVACDQYTSEPDYWNSVKKEVGDKPSTLNLVYPEIYLKEDNFEERIENINNAMKNYLNNNIFKEYKNSLFYIERTLRNGKLRKGIIGMVDLECYDYQKGSQSQIRATEGTVLERIPPRVKIRENAPLELPHVMLLVDDVDKKIIEEIVDSKKDIVYDFEMMQQSGSIKGYLLSENEVNAIDDGICKLSESFNERYNVTDKGTLLFAVGDGNHSLATAKKCYMNLKEQIGDRALESPARYALVEVVNLHDNSLEFEAIHRVIFDVNPQEVMAALAKKFELSETSGNNANEQKVEVVIGDTVKAVYITNPTLNLAAGSLQSFIDEYLSTHSGEVDYIHGEDVVKKLARKDNSIGFILESMDKNDLFKTVILDGALPRKTFSMGEACDKRFYFEARKIK